MCPGRGEGKKEGIKSCILADARSKGILKGSSRKTFFEIFDGRSVNMYVYRIEVLYIIYSFKLDRSCMIYK